MGKFDGGAWERRGFYLRCGCCVCSGGKGRGGCGCGWERQAAPCEGLVVTSECEKGLADEVGP